MTITTLIAKAAIKAITHQSSYLAARIAHRLAYQVAEFIKRIEANGAIR